MLPLDCVHSESDGQLQSLPRRLLYAGDCINIQLVGLEASRNLLGYSPLGRILLLVAFGQIQLHASKVFRVLVEGDEFLLDPACEYNIYTERVADLLLITLPPKRHVSTGDDINRRKVSSATRER